MTFPLHFIHYSTLLAKLLGRVGALREWARLTANFQHGGSTQHYVWYGRKGWEELSKIGQRLKELNGNIDVKFIDGVFKQVLCIWGGIGVERGREIESR